MFPAVEASVPRTEIRELVVDEALDATALQRIWGGRGAEPRAPRGVPLGLRRALDRALAPPAAPPSRPNV
jgi:hypothetical protein